MRCKDKQGIVAAVSTCIHFSHGNIVKAQQFDEAPIIAQDAEHVSHSDMPQDLVRKGRDIEHHILARAVRYHFKNRILINGSKTLVFKD